MVTFTGPLGVADCIIVKEEPTGLQDGVGGVGSGPVRQLKERVVGILTCQAWACT